MAATQKTPRASAMVSHCARWIAPSHGPQENVNLYLLSQTENREFDSFDSAIVAAVDAATAQKIVPVRYAELPEHWRDGWTEPENVAVKLIGVAEEGIKEGVILASFNAG